MALFLNIIASKIYPPILNAPDYLATVYPNKIPVTMGILLDFICAPAMIFIPIMLFPLFKMFNERIALGYVVFRLLEGILFIFIAINSLSLISLSQDYITSGGPDVSYFQVLGNSIHARIEWATLLYIIVYTLGAFLFYYLLYKSKLIPMVIRLGAFVSCSFVNRRLVTHVRHIRYHAVDEGYALFCASHRLAGNSYVNMADSQRIQFICNRSRVGRSG